MRRLIVLGLLFAGTLFSISARAAIPHIIICSTCGSGISFVSAATDGFDQVSPDVHEGVKDIFVVNLATRVTHFYKVTKNYDASGDKPRAGDALIIEAKLAKPNAVDERNVNDSITVLDDFLSKFGKPVDADDLGLSFGSAVDLIGSTDSAAGLNRNGLSNGLSDHYRDLSVALLAPVNDTVSQIIKGYILRNGIQWVPPVTVVFSDDSRVNYAVKSFGTGLLSADVINVEFTPDLSTVRAPGLNAIPQSDGQLAGFDWTSANRELSEALMRLFERLGASTTLSEGGNCQQLSCTAEGGQVSCVTQSVQVANC